MPAKRHRGSIDEADRIGRRGVGLTTATITANEQLSTDPVREARGAVGIGVLWRGTRLTSV